MAMACSQEYHCARSISPDTYVGGGQTQKIPSVDTGIAYMPVHVFAASSYDPHNISLSNTRALTVLFQPERHNKFPGRFSLASPRQFQVRLCRM